MEHNHPNRNETNTPKIFSMPLVGANISRLRKQKGMTQMQLADAMGISFQAVSNWERGLSCPDVSKLADLSELFGVSIDDILGNCRSAQIAAEIARHEAPEMTLEEAEQLAPILPEEQVERAVKEHASDERLSGEDLILLAPFLSRKMLDRLVMDYAEAPDSFDELVALAPFLSHETLDRLVDRISGEGSFDSLVALAPFLSRGTLSRLVSEKLNQTGSVRSILSLLPFLGQDALEGLLNRRS